MIDQTASRAYGTASVQPSPIVSGQSANMSSNLGQADFLTLMTAQLQYQDPFKPMENGEFLAQMAQFSTVSGIEDVNRTLSSIGDRMQSFRVATTANMLGHSVLVPGNIARADEGGAINGVVDLPEPAQSVVVTYSDATTGALLSSQTSGAQPAGLMGFSWTELPMDLAALRSPIRVDVTLNTGTSSQQIGPSVFARVLSARTAVGTEDITLQIEDFGDLHALEIGAFR